MGLSKLWAGISFLFILAFAVNAQSLDVVEPEISIILFQGAVKEAAFTIENTGSTSILPEFSHDLDLIDNDGDKIILSFSDPGDINPGESALVALNAAADKKMDFETYAGIVLVKDVNSDAQDTFQLSIKVEPNICDFGQTGNDIVIDIENPNTDEDFEPGDAIDIKLNVKNAGDDDIRTQVEAFLFSDKSQIASAASETMNIENDEDEDFELSLDIPLDSRKIDEDDDFTLFVKAFDDDGEQLNCVQSSVAMDLKLSAKKVIIDEEETRFLPSVASCGDSVVANVHMVNIGDKDNNQVRVTLSNTEMGIVEQSSIFKIEAFSSEDNDATSQFSLKIPLNINPKTYFFTAQVDYDGGSQSEQVSLEVISCETTESILRRGEAVAKISLLASQMTAAPSAIINIPVKIQNVHSAKQTFVISLTNIRELGTSTPKSIIINPGQEVTVFLDVQLRSDVAPGIHTAVIEVRSGSLTVASETIALEITPQQEAEAFSLIKFTSSLPLGGWVILDAAIIIIVAAAVILLMRNHKPKNEKIEQ